jgi:hypothetical protein
MSRGGRHWILGGVAGVAIVGLLAVAVLSGWLGRPAARAGIGPDTSAAPSGDEVAQVMTLLDGRARSLLGRDVAGWDDALDSAPAAAAFGTAQRAVFANLAQVPLTVWRYSLVAAVTSPDVLVPAARALAGRVVVLHVQLAYALARVDQLPTQKDQWLTAVRRGSQWKLAADTDVAATGGQSWRGPWDFGPVDVLRGAHTLVLAHPAHAADLGTFSTLVERSIPVVSGVWGPRWNTQVAVLIPDTAAEFAAVTADTGDTSDLAAVSVADQVLGDGTVLGARIVLNPTTLGRLDAAGRRLVVQHELTHIAARGVTNDQMPDWVIEGFADYVGNLGSTLTLRQIAPELGAEVARSKLPVALPTRTDFDGTNPRLAQAYEESWLACRLIAARVGASGLVRFYTLVSRGALSDPSTAADEALRSVVHLNLAAFTAAWRAQIRHELGAQ